MLPFIGGSCLRSAAGSWGAPRRFGPSELSRARANACAVFFLVSFVIRDRRACKCCFNTAQRGAGLPQCPSVIRRFAKVNGFGTTRRQLIEWSAIHPLQDSTSPRLQIFCSADAKNSPLRPLARQIGPVDIKGELIWDRLCIDGLRSAKRNRPRAHLHASSGERFWDDPL